MKHLILSTLALLWIFTPLSAQITDQQAREQYQQAEALYEKGDNNQCYEVCQDLIDKLGEANPRILYLALKSAYNSLEKKNDKSELSFKKTYKNFSILNEDAEKFFSMIDKNTYPSEKYREMVEIREYIQAGLKTYAYQNERKPEDAINFLNDCARKFAIKADASPVKDCIVCGSCEVSFSLNGSQLIINVFGTYEDKYDRGSNQAGRERIVIDLSKVWIKNFEYKYHNVLTYQHFFTLEFGNIAIHEIHENRNLSHFWKTDEAAPMIVGPTIYIDGKAKYDNIDWYYDFEYNKKLIYKIEDFEKHLNSHGMVKTGVGFYIYNFFNQDWNDEFKAGKYRERILEAFEFLIDYFGGGTPTQNKQENDKNKSKF